nr:glycosyltransferase family 4 protein [Aeromonas veronii]
MNVTTKTAWVINQYASTPATGIGGRHYYLARELVKQGYRVYLIASSANHLLHHKPEINQPYKVEQVDGVDFVWVKMPQYSDAHSKRRALSWFLFAWRLQGLVGFLTKPDVILYSSPSPIAFLGAEWLANKFKARLVFEVRDIWPLTLTEIGGYSAKHPFIKIMQWIEDRAYRRADAVISNLKHAVEHMVSRGMSREKFSWIPNGFSLDEVNQNVPLSDSVYQQLPQDKFVVGYTGTLGVANALDTFILAAEKLREHTDIVFVLVGGGKEKTSLQAMVSSKRLHNVIFIEPIPKVKIQAMLSNFDACYIGLTKDPLFKFGVSPNKLFDYLYSGKPVIYSIESGEYRPVADANAGIQISSENPDELAEAVLTLYHMPAEKRTLLGANGHKAATAQYEYCQLAQQLAKVMFFSEIAMNNDRNYNSNNRKPWFKNEKTL